MTTTSHYALSWSGDSTGANTKGSSSLILILLALARTTGCFLMVKTDLTKPPL